MGTTTKRQTQSFCPEDLGTLLMIFLTENEAPIDVATRVVELSVLVGLDNVLLEEILFFLRWHASSIFMRYSWEDSFQVWMSYGAGFTATAGLRMCKWCDRTGLTVHRYVIS